MGRVACLQWLYAQNVVQWNTAPSGYAFQNVVNWWALGTPFGAVNSPAAAHYAVFPWNGVATFPDAGVKCPAADNYVLLEKGDYHLLIDSAAVKTALEAESAATRAVLDSKLSQVDSSVNLGASTTASNIAMARNEAMAYSSEWAGYYGVALVSVFLLAGFFFGFRFANSASNQ